MFRSEGNNSKINLGDSYTKNYEFLFKGTKTQDEDNVATFNNLPVFKYKKLILKYDHMPNENQIKSDIQAFVDKINVNDSFKVFNIKANTIQKDNQAKEYVITVALINVNIN